MAGRFIKLYDKILQWEWFQHPNTLCLFIYLLLKASYKDIEYRGRIIKRGQLVTSLTRISTDTGLSVQQARTALMHLKSTGEVTDESDSVSRVITIVKYEDYQSSTSDSTGNQQATNRRINKRSTGDSTDESTTSIEYIEIQKDRNIENSPSESNCPDLLPTPYFDFDVFWNKYPRKVAKADAMKAWKSLKVNEDLMTRIMAGLKKWIESDQWNRDSGKYIPYPASWLRGRRWEDEVNGSWPPVRADGTPVQKSAPAPIRVNAQNYDQRDYSPVQDDIMQRQEQRVLEYMRRKEQGL